MPTVNIKRDLLFEALGTTYSNFFKIFFMIDVLSLLFFQLMKSLTTCAFRMDWSLTKW